MRIEKGKRGFLNFVLLFFVICNENEISSTEAQKQRKGLEDGLVRLVQV